MDSKPQTTSLRVRLQTANEYGIWTGGADGSMDSVKSTSLLGGLRFWTGALLRANGEQVCEERSCMGDKTGKKPCALCSMFGCTGVSRVFSLTIDNQEACRFARPIEKGKLKKVLLAQYAYNIKKGVKKVPTSYLTQGYCGSLDLSLLLHRPHNGTFAIPQEVCTALYLMLTYGTLGAYDQYGCGLMRFAEKGGREELAQLCLAQGKSGAAPMGLSLRDFFFFKGQVKGNRYDAMAEIRYLIRQSLRKGSVDGLRHWFCGSLGNTAKKENASGTNYMFSIDTEGQLYGWGFYPRTSNLSSEFTAQREWVLNNVRNVLGGEKAAAKSLVWRECSSDRDTVGKKDWPNFYADLLHNTWRQA